MNKKLNRPPSLALWIIEKIAFSDDVTSIKGDFTEDYSYHAEKSGRFSSYVFCWFLVFRTMFSFFIYYFRWSFIMFKNYLKISLRNLKRHRVYTFINISGLALGLTCCILMILCVIDDLSFDKFHKHANEIYRVLTTDRTGDRNVISPKTPLPLGTALIQEYPEIINSARYEGGFIGSKLQYKDKVFYNDAQAYTDPVFFRMFSFTFLKGNPKTVLDDPASVVITEKVADKYFGTEDPMGKILILNEKPLKVTGVLSIPENSHIQFDIIYNIKRILESQNAEKWNLTFTNTYIQIRKDVLYKNVEEKISDIINKYNTDSNIFLSLQPLKEVHLYSNFRWDFSNANKGNINKVYILSSIALCILLIACINFVNLSTARAGDRAKEVGIRKVIGAYRKNIIIQFFGESILLTVSAFIFSIFLVFLFLPVFNGISGKQLSFTLFLNPKILFSMVTIILFSGILSGIYPALILSSFQPVKVLKGTFKRADFHSLFLKVLVVVQFTFAVILLISTIVIYNQLNYMTTKDLGFDRKNIVELHRRGLFLSNFDYVKNQLLQNPNILKVSKSLGPMAYFSESSDVDWEGKEKNNKITMNFLPVDYNYLNILNLQMTEGRFFSKEISDDASNYIINETAVKAMGVKSPLGKRFKLRGSEGIIIGVLKDFHQNNLLNKIEPSVFKISDESFIAMIKIQEDNISETISFIKNKWKQFVPDRPFQYNLLEERLKLFYKAERKMVNIGKFAVILSILVSSLGLFGQSFYTAAQRTKEISIRKVFGASKSRIMIYMSKSLIIWVLLSNVIAWPAARYIMNKWLMNYAYRTSIGFSIYIAAGCITCFIALIVISYQLIKVSSTNPVDSLRFE